LTTQKLRVATEVRKSHFALKGKQDSDTDELHRRLVELEDYVNNRIAILIKAHPAYPWFSRVKGVGEENIAKVVGLIDIERADTISALWKFSGRAPENGKAPKKEKGKKLSYNSQLRSMTWRLGVSLLKAGLRQKCYKCGHLFGSEHDACPKCLSAEFGQVTISNFATYYIKQKETEHQKALANGIKIIPTPKGRVCPDCAIEVKASATNYCPDCGTRLMRKVEPEGILFEGHVHNRALAKTVKLFLACLWLTWREAVKLSVTKPYSVDILGHNNFISPWEMVDR
ncbi:unnamed protein product, partial [marine sediment metagenome]